MEFVSLHCKRQACNFRGHFSALKRGKILSFSIYSMEKGKSIQNPNYVIGKINYIAHPMKSSRIAQSLLLQNRCLCMISASHCQTNKPQRK